MGVDFSSGTLLGRAPSEAAFDAFKTRSSHVLSSATSSVSKIVDGASTSSADPKRNDSNATMTLITWAFGMPALASACETVLYMRKVLGACDTGVTAIVGISDGYSANTAR